MKCATFNLVWAFQFIIFMSNVNLCGKKIKKQQLFIAAWSIDTHIWENEKCATHDWIVRDKYK